MASKPTAVPRTALLVEDDPPLRKLVMSYLQLLNFSVLEAADGHHAMLELGSKPYDLICLDLMLPESSGYDVLEFMLQKGMGKGTPVLMMSARSLPEDRAQAEELGATLYLIKPFTRAEFTKAVRAVLEPAQ